MVLDLTDEQTAFQQEIAAFAAERLAPAAAGIDEDGRFPLALVKELAGRGLLGVTIPRAWGGAERDYVSYALALEAVARASAVLSVIASVNNSLVAEPIAEFGSEEQKQLWLRRLATGDAIGAFALSEEQAGSDAANQQTSARLDDRGYLLTGRNVWDANADPFTNTVDVHMRFLRQKVDSGHKRKLLKTVHGYGYKFEAARGKH